jgi:hypothetical protein
MQGRQAALASRVDLRLILPPPPLDTSSAPQRSSFCEIVDLVGLWLNRQKFDAGLGMSDSNECKE